MKSNTRYENVELVYLRRKIHRNNHPAKIIQLIVKIFWESGGRLTHSTKLLKEIILKNSIIYRLMRWRMTAGCWWDDGTRFYGAEVDTKPTLRSCFLQFLRCASVGHFCRHRVRSTLRVLLQVACALSVAKVVFITDDNSTRKVLDTCGNDVNRSAT
jgi:hypothetical protein